MEEERTENQSEAINSSSHQENSPGTSQNSSALQVSRKDELQIELKDYVDTISAFLHLYFSSECTCAAVFLSAAQGSLCCITSGRAPRPELGPPSLQNPRENHQTKPGTTSDGPERPEGPARTDEESAQVWLSFCNHTSEDY